MVFKSMVKEKRREHQVWNQRPTASFLNTLPYFTWQKTLTTHYCKLALCTPVPPYSEQYLAFSRCSINTCCMNMKR